MRYFVEQLITREFNLIRFFNSLVDNLDMLKKQEQYVFLLEKTLKSLNILVSIKDSSGKYLVKDSVISKLFDIKDNDVINLDGKKYRYFSRKIRHNFKEFEVLLLLDITDYIENDKQKETMLATIVHDLKTPVVACEKAVSLVKSGHYGEVTSSQYEILEMCIRSLSFSKYLIGNILCEYKHSQKYLGLNLLRFEFVSLIKECASELAMFAKEKSITLVLNLPQCYYVEADRNELKRVVLNLIYNAVSYSFENTEIDVVLSFNDEFLLFEIKNNGNYIPAETIKMIFNKNISLNNGYNKMGTGLGLYLSKEIILAHNGEMIAKSFPNNKNIFGFKLKHSDVFNPVVELKR